MASEHTGLSSQHSRNRSKKHTVQQRQEHVQRYLRSGRTMSAYCNSQQIPISTFSTWVSNHTQRENSAFVPAQVRKNINQKTRTDETPSKSLQCTSAPASPLHRIEIQRNDCKVLLEVDHRTVVEFLKGALLCN